VIVDRLKGNQLGKMVSVDVESRFAPPLLHSALLTALKQTHISTRSYGARVRDMGHRPTRGLWWRRNRA